MGSVPLFSMRVNTGGGVAEAGRGGSIGDGGKTAREVPQSKEVGGLGTHTVWRYASRTTREPGIPRASPAALPAPEPQRG